MHHLLTVLMLNVCSSLRVVALNLLWLGLSLHLHFPFPALTLGGHTSNSFFKRMINFSVGRPTSALWKSEMCSNGANRAVVFQWAFSCFTWFSHALPLITCQKHLSQGRTGIYFIMRFWKPALLSPFVVGQLPFGGNLCEHGIAINIRKLSRRHCRTNI